MAKRRAKKKISRKAKALVVNRNLEKARAARWAGHKKAVRTRPKAWLSHKQRAALNANLKAARAKRWAGHKKTKRKLMSKAQRRKVAIRNLKRAHAAKRAARRGAGTSL